MHHVHWIFVQVPPWLFVFLKTVKSIVLDLNRKHMWCFFPIKLDKNWVSYVVFKFGIASNEQQPWWKSCIIFFSHELSNSELTMKSTTAGSTRTCVFVNFRPILRIVASRGALSSISLLTFRYPWRIIHDTHKPSRKGLLDVTSPLKFFPLNKT